MVSSLASSTLTQERDFSGDFESPPVLEFQPYSSLCVIFIFFLAGLGLQNHKLNILHYRGLVMPFSPADSMTSEGLLFFTLKGNGTVSFIPGWNVGSFWSLPGRRTAVGISQCIFVEVVNLVRKILRAEGARKFPDIIL